MADLRSDETLKESGLTPDDLEHFKGLRFTYFDTLVTYDQAVASNDYGKQLEIESEIPRMEAELKAFGANPRDVPLKDIAILAHAPQAPHTDDPIVARYKERIKNPATGIRAFCIMCQGGSTVGVTECAAVNCPLYYFRDGKNPLFGRTLPPANFLEIEGDDTDDIDESEDGADAE